MSLLKENISFVVVCYKSSAALKSLLISIPKELEVVLVDNSNDKETSEIANSYDCTLIQNQENIGYGAACNLGAEKASGTYLLFINPDSELKPETLNELIKAADNYPNASAFNPKIIDRKNNHYFKRRSVLMPRSEWMSRKYPKTDCEVSVLHGSAIFIKKENFFKNIICLFAGEQKNSEKYIHKLNKLISSYSLEKKIRLIGKVENMPLAYHASDVILSPSIEPEPFGRIPIEAQASGKIIISCDAGAVKDTIKSGKNYTGFKAIPNNSESLADKLKKALKLENEEIHGIKERAILNVKNNFSLESMCKKTLEVYNRLLISK